MAWNPLEYDEDYILRKSFSRPRFYDVICCDYALCGAYVMREYVPERATYSFDLYVSYSDLATAHTRLQPYVTKQAMFSNTHGYYVLKRDRIHFNLIALAQPWGLEALEASQRNLDLQTAEPKLSFPWLILSKMSYGKRQDYMDCARLMARANGKNIIDTKELMTRWFPEGIPALRELYRVGRRELEAQPDKKPFTNHTNEPLDWHQIALSYESYEDRTWKETFADLSYISFPEDWESATDP